MADKEELLTAGNVSALLKISKPTLWKLRDRGDLPCIYCGTKSPRWKKSVVEAFMVNGVHPEAIR